MGKHNLQSVRTSVSPTMTKSDRSQHKFDLTSAHAGVDMKQAIIDAIKMDTDASAPVTPLHLIISSSAVAPVASSSPSSFVSGVRLIASVARPVSVAASQVFHSWLGALSSGVARARSIRNDWQEAQVARRQVRELRAAYALQQQQAKERERAAMRRLQELEAQVATMQQQSGTQ
jgi:hypothetical protein